MSTDEAVNAVLHILYEEGVTPYGPARVRDFMPEGRTATSEELAALKAADQEADAKNRAFAQRIVDAVLASGLPRDTKEQQ